MSVFIGIDPGLSGGIAVITPQAYTVHDMPTMQIGNGRKRNATTGKMVDKVKNKYHITEIIRILTQVRDYAHEKGWPVEVWLENVHAMPGQGVTSMFSMGEGLGILQTIPICLQMPLNFISPVTWKRKIMAGQGKEKDAAVFKAQQIFPMAVLKTRRGRLLDGRAEALLIAHFGKQESTGSNKFTL